MIPPNVPEPPLDDLPNPFAEVFTQASRSRRGNTKTNLKREEAAAKPNATPETTAFATNSFQPVGASWKKKVLQLLAKWTFRGAIVASLFFVMVALSARAPKWIADHLVSDFSSLDEETQKQRLLQFESLGNAGTKGLVLGMKEAPDVAQLTEKLIRERIASWEKIEEEKAKRSAESLLIAIRETWPDMGQDHRSPVYRLLLDAQRKWKTAFPSDSLNHHFRKTATDFYNQPGAFRLVRDPNDNADGEQLVDGQGVVATSLNTTASNGSAQTSTGGTNLSSTQSQYSKPQLLRNSSVQVGGANVSRNLGSPKPPSSVAELGGEQWTDWPPADRERTMGNDATAAIRPPSSDMAVKTNSQPIVLKKVQEPGKVQPLRSTSPTERMQARSLDSPPAGDLSVDAPSLAQAVRSYSDETLFDLLISDDANMRDAVELELLSRDFEPIDLDLARLSKSPHLADRISMVEQLPNLKTRDPRPWLRHMLNDPDREVRLRVISIIASMNDPEGWLVLRLHQATEVDSVVIARLDRVLKTNVR